MMFNRSLLNPLEYRPWRYTTPPTYNPDGSEATAGVKQTMNGVFILLSPELVAILKANLTQAEKDEIDAWVYPVTEEQAALWHVPVWAGQASATYFRIPAAVWNDPTGAPPATVKRYFADLWREATA